MTDSKIDELQGPILIQTDVKPQFSIYLESEEMIRITPEGFYVRGKKVEQGPGEAQEVYKAFSEFLAKTKEPSSQFEELQD